MGRDIKVIQKDNAVFAKFVELVPEACEVARKFDGKKVTKRISNALCEVIPSLYIKIENCVGNPDKKEIVFSIVENGCNAYLFYVVTPVDSFDASAVIERLEKSAEYYSNKIAEFNDALPNIDKIMDEYNTALESFLTARKAIPSYIREVLNIKDEYIAKAYYHV